MFYAVYDAAGVLDSVWLTYSAAVGRVAGRPGWTIVEVEDEPPTDPTAA